MFFNSDNDNVIIDVSLYNDNNNFVINKSLYNENAGNRKLFIYLQIMIIGYN